ncbi:MAG: PKD domain-containing protein, partial [Candidatus Sifarchaeia archaeon]
VSYDWDFGDGNTGTGISPTHSYSAAGTFTVFLTVTDNDDATDTALTTATISAGPIVLDLDIAQFRTTKRVRLARVKPVGIKLVVKNNGDVNSQTRPANVIGIQAGVEVYNRTMDVSDPVGDGRTRFEFPVFTPNAVGDIMWTATIADDDPDVDFTTATTRVVP